MHSHINHLKAICDLCKQHGISKLFIHVFTDGRDTDPKSGLGFVRELEDHLKNSAGTIASVSGRYYAMDRDKRWERVKLAYDCLVKAAGPTAPDAITAIEKAYAAGTTDEFILPTVITNGNGQPIATIKADDAVICFNFRTDRCRRLQKY